MNILGNLANKPLVEALFELKWGPDTSEALGYPIIVGALYEKLKDEFPEIEDLPINRVPPEMTMHLVRHRLRKTSGGWPLVQIGPGIMTVNETDGYTNWDEFYTVVARVLDHVYAAHPKRHEIVAEGFLLRYINAIEFDFEQEDVLLFLRDHLKTSVSLDDNLFAVGSAARKPGELILRLSFTLGKPAGSGIVQFASGLKSGKPAIIWELMVESKPPLVKTLPGGAGAWLQEAHEVIEHWFVQLSKGELLESFKRKPN